MAGLERHLLYQVLLLLILAAVVEALFKVGRQEVVEVAAVVLEQTQAQRQLRER